MEIRSPQTVALQTPKLEHTESYIPTAIAGFAGWLLDSYDFFLTAFCLTAIAKEFHKSDAQVALLITMTLAFRPVGGFFFGLVADRYGRKLPFMINLALFAIAEIATGLSTSFMMLLGARAFFGVVMGGQWGVGSSLVMDATPRARRGVVSGFLQEGYAAGNILAALSFMLLFSHVGWRNLFFLGPLPALLVLLFVKAGVKESTDWKHVRKQGWRRHASEILAHGRLFLYLLAFMTMMLFASHGTQDMYPTFLQRQWGFSPEQRSSVTIVAGIGAIAGGIAGGRLSDSFGRRKVIICAFGCGILVAPLWAFAPNPILLVTGAFLMQFMVQAAWGVIPVYLTELAPSSMRAFLPGFTYQTAGVLASSVVFMEAAFARHADYSAAMALTAVTVFLLASLLAMFGGSQHSVDTEGS